MRPSLLAFVAAAFLLTSANAIAATTSCSSVAACLMGTNSSSGPGVGGTSKTGFGISGTSTSGHGVNGTSASSFGVVGITTENATSTSTARAGVYGEDSSTNKNRYNSGVSGTSTYGTGVLGTTANTNGYGVEGTNSKGIGVYGGSTGNTGVFGYTNGGAFAVIGNSPNGGVGVLGQAGKYGGEFIGGTGVYIEGIDDILIGQNDSKDVVSIDNNGNEILAGSLMTSSAPLVRTKSIAGEDVASFSARTAAPSLEDVGKAQLRNGAAYVALDRTFASTIDPHVAYSVFVTPEGDSNGVYTTQLSPSGFAVRENKGGRSSLVFDYRIVAKPLDAHASHLPAISSFAQLPRSNGKPTIRLPRQ